MYRKQKNEKDVLYILDHLRADDLEEVKAVHGDKWKQQVYDDIMKTDFDVLMGVTKKGDIPVCMGGAWHLEKDEPGVGVVWMLCTDEISKHKICLLRELKKEFQKYDKTFWFLYNFIYYKNEFSKNWLQWMGFNFTKSTNEKFEFFYRIREKRGLCDF
ncbi:MAG: hypothetical protein LUH11_02430 [Candidatus Gastranaerophilales bacterium]|nr:hypothetical protein [Candidatus Gastranaerophilales bacterium]